MPTQRHEREFAESINAVFLALIGALAKRRWDDGLVSDGAVPVPKVGCRYVNQRGSVLRCGRVMECLRPVVLTFYETLFDTPCRVRLQFRWRVEPVAKGSLLRLLVRYRLNSAAGLRRRHWARQIDAHCSRMLACVQARLSAQGINQCANAGVNGHNSGNSNMLTAKISAVSGKPIFR